MSATLHILKQDDADVEDSLSSPPDEDDPDAGDLSPEERERRAHERKLRLRRKALSRTKERNRKLDHQLAGNLRQLLEFDNDIVGADRGVRRAARPPGGTICVTRNGCRTTSQACWCLSTLAPLPSGSSSRALGDRRNW